MFTWDNWTRTDEVGGTTHTQAHEDGLYLLLVPGTTTAPPSSFFLRNNAANLFLVVGAVLPFFLTVLPSSRSGMSISEEFKDLGPSQLFFLVFFVNEREY